MHFAKKVQYCNKNFVPLLYYHRAVRVFLRSPYGNGHCHFVGIDVRALHKTERSTGRDGLRVDHRDFGCDQPLLAS